MAWITEPAQRNRQPLKNACVMTWKKPAAKAPTPTPMNMKPSWLTVEYASTFFRSVCAKAIDAARMAVKAPVQAMIAIAAGDITKRKERRATRYTPAVTMVAAWMSAETGVGPAMASGSHT